MTYMTSYSSNNGSSTINVTFDIGYDLDIAAVDTQNYASIAYPQIPDDVRKYGVTTKKQATDFILVVNLLSSDKKYDDLFLSNYASINIEDTLKRIPGVGNVTIFGERKYSMRFWLDPDKLASLKLTADDVISAINEQNIQVAAGSIGSPPSLPTQAFQFTLTTKGRLATTEEFGNIIIRTGEDNSVVRMKDVGKIEMGAENYNSFSRLSGQHSASVGIYQFPGANAVNIANDSRKIMEELSKRFPKGVTYRIAYDATMFVKESVAEVIKTLVIAMFLVFLVIFIFLQNFRTTLIPAITIPVSLIGTFALLLAFGFSINTLTLFGLVLAIGLVVDDSIVVVENVSRIMAEEGLPPMEATEKAMQEVVGPIIATTLVLMAVFIPVSFMPGITGQLYKQFALTIAISVGISAINALTLSPALCAVILKSESSHGWFFSKFNQGFTTLTKTYSKWNEIFIKKWKIVIAAFLVMIALTGLLFHLLPTGFVPDEDQGYFYLLLKGPEGASLERTDKVTKQVEDILLKTHGIADVLTIGGFNIVNSTSDTSASSLVVILKPWHERKTKELSVTSIMKETYYKLRSIPQITAAPFNPPPIRGLSTTGGFQFELQDLENGSLADLKQISQSFIDEAKKRPELTPLTSNFNINYPGYYIDLDRTKAKTLGIDLSKIFITLQTQLGSIYVNDFNKFGRVYRVFVQAEKDFRSSKEDISHLYVKSKYNEMIPLSSLVTIHEVRDVQTITHYNLFRAVGLDGANTPDYSSNQAIKAMQEIADKVLPEGYAYEWTGTAYQELKAGSLMVGKNWTKKRA